MRSERSAKAIQTVTLRKLSEPMEIAYLRDIVDSIVDCGRGVGGKTSDFGLETLGLQGNHNFSE